MRQISNNEYEVSPNTKVIVTTTPFGTAPTVTAAQNGANIEPENADTEPRFRFLVTEPENGLHFMKLRCDFQEDNEPSARYEVAIANSDGSTFSAFPVAKTDSIKEPEYNFTVVAGA